MKIILASSNQGKINEYKSLMEEFEVYAFSELLTPFEIIENGDSFKKNAFIKAREVYRALKNRSAIVMSDDSGISVNILDGKPGIHSARYAGVKATSKENLDKLVRTLKNRDIKRTPAYYSAAIAIVCEKGEFCTHGWMHGDVIDDKRGNNGFGYDSIFIPEGFKQTLGELDDSVKKEISHRFKALELSKILLNRLKKGRNE